MRGLDGRTGSMFSYVDLEERIASGHPLRKIRKIGNARWQRSTLSLRSFMPPKDALRLRPSGSCARH